MRLTRRNSARTSIDQPDVGVLAHAIEDDLPAVGSEVEVTNREVQTEVGQLAFGPVFEIDEPEVLVLDLSS
jgi:hypothetical protein